MSIQFHRAEPMIRINAPWLIETVAAIDSLDSLVADQTIAEAMMPLLVVQGRLEGIFSQNSLYGDHLRASRIAATSLYEDINQHLAKDKWNENKIDQYAVTAIKDKKASFKTVFLADLAVLPIYLVSKKDTFDVNLLIEAGVRLFPSTIMTKCPEVEKDANEIGRALAYELPTACGFHTFRVIESVVRRYWDEASKGKERPKLQTLGNFASEMEKQKVGDEKVVEAIKQMTKLHRNPLIHPEVILTVEEAIGIIGMARRVISPMLQVLPDAPTTTGAPALPPAEASK